MENTDPRIAHLPRGPDYRHFDDVGKIVEFAHIRTKLPPVQRVMVMGTTEDHLITCRYYDFEEGVPVPRPESAQTLDLSEIISYKPRDVI